MSRFEGVLAAVRQNLGAGRAAQAQAALQRALQRDAADAGLNGAMAVVQARLGEVQRAVYFAARAARACPEQPHCLADFASALVETGRTDEGLREFEALVSREGSRPWLLVSAACVVRAAGRYVGAARLMELALEAGGGDAALGPSAINDWMNGGQGMAGAALAARLSQRNPEHVDFAGLRAYLANYPDHAGDVVGFHRTFGEMLQRTVPARTGGHSGSRDPLRRIRVGLLSPDLRLSAVAFFIEPFFTHRDRGAFELFGYSVALKEDAVGARLRGEADGWLHQPEWTDEQIAAAVERDRVDVLVDLAGLTGYSRLGVMAMRPAPVSLTYLGYPNTTGLKTIDWRIVDALTDPPGSESDSTERLARMDGCFVCYRPREGFPSVAERGAGPVTFGSFNNLLKFNPGVARLWGRVLDVVPGARLVMKAPQLGDPGARAEVVKTFQGAGADLSRIELLAPAPGLREHLEAYARVDIALDTFPYCGTTTTCEALLMGVPVVTLRGDSHRGRVGQSLLSAVGVPELVALDEDGYVGLAARLAADRGALRAMRVGLRGKLLGSALCDGPGWCRRFESVLRGAWGAYCAGHGSDDRRSV